MEAVIIAVRILQEVSNANVDQGFDLCPTEKDALVRIVFTPLPLNTTYCTVLWRACIEHSQGSHFGVMSKRCIASVSVQ